MNYYNEIDKFCAQWLRNLVDAAFIPDGDVDERSIVDVSAAEVKGYTQCHFFAGIGGWSYALRLAGWGEDQRVWTGSCPCQSYSIAGKQRGNADARHLWPTWFRLIRQCHPPVLFGEEVAAAIAFGWLDEVAHDLESENYAIGAAVLPACSVGAPHRRDRLYFAADARSADAGWRDEDRRRITQPQSMGSEWAYSEWNGGQAESGVLDDGIPDGMAKRIASGFGNAIVPELAAEVIRAWMETMPR